MRKQIKNATVLNAFLTLLFSGKIYLCAAQAPEAGGKTRRKKSYSK